MSDTPRHADDAAILAAFAQQRRQGLTRRSALHQALLQLIAAGELPWRTKLPPSRALAARLAVARDTVEQTYARLEAEGFISRTVGRGSFVRYRCDTLLGRELLATATGQEARLAERELSDRGRALLAVSHTPHTSRQASLTPSLADLRAFPIDQWLQREKQALRQHGERLLGYADPQGLPELRAEIAHYLQRERGVKATAEQVIVVTSSQQALALCTQVLFDPGDAVFVEEPGYQGAKKLVQSAGLQARPIGIDEQGLDVGQLMQASGGGRGVYITPSHHYPLGYSLSLDRRLALLQWAQRQRAWIIEDDYDAEFNYDRQTKAALQGLDGGGRTLYLGTFSKTLFPSLRIGFMVLPPMLVETAQPAIRALLRGGHRAEQRALASFIEEGHYARHLAAMRRLYRKRQAQLRAALGEELSVPHELMAGEGGLHMTVAIDGIDDVSLVRQARAHQMTPSALSTFYLDRQHARTGLVLGYGNTSTSQFAPAIRTLQRLIAPLRRGQE